MTPLTDLLYEITGLAMSIQRERGPAHLEKVYHNLFLARLQAHGYQVENKPNLWLKDDLGNYIQKYTPDLCVLHGGISTLVELKASPSRLSIADERQAKAYLSVSPDDEAVLLINFGRIPFEQKRIYQRSGNHR